jgi:hypothetical protein
MYQRYAEPLGTEIDMAKLGVVLFRLIVKTILSTTVCTALLSFTDDRTSVGPVSDHKDDQISVELSLKGPGVVKAGEPLIFRVTVRNTGLREVFVSRDISLVNERFVMYLQNGLRLERPLTHVVADSFVDRAKPFSVLLSENWILLKPGYSYGTEVIMDTRDFPTLQIPGKYLVKGIYRSSGFNDVPESNPLRGWETEIGKLPFDAWKGKVETNPIWITVRKELQE